MKFFLFDIKIVKQKKIILLSNIILLNFEHMKTSIFKIYLVKFLTFTKTNYRTNRIFVKYFY